jgi:hypothetical protein
MTTLLTPEIIIGPVTERCDRCGAAAKIEVELTAGGSLAFCGHHANKHADQFGGIAAKVTVEDGFDFAGPASPS